MKQATAILLLTVVATFAAVSAREVLSPEAAHQLRIRADMHDKEVSSVMEARAHRLGNVNRGRNRQAELEAGPLGWFLGIATGLSYNINAQTNCYSAVASSVLSIDDLFSLLVELYDVTQWADISLVLQSIVTYSALVIYDCEVADMVQTLSGFISLQGASALGARLGVTVLFELSDILDAL